MYKIFNTLLRFPPFLKFFNTPRYFKILSGPLRGYFIYLAPRHGVKKIIGNYEKYVTQTLIANVHSGDVCLDLGSHLGYLSLAMRRSAGKSGTIVAIDPISSNIQDTLKSFKKNKFRNVIGIACGAGDKSKILKADVYDDSDMANFSDSNFQPHIKAQATQTFQVKTVDSMVREHKLKTVNFMKVDVEGYEVKALEGAMQTIKKYHPTILVEIHKDEYGANIFNRLSDLGYELSDMDGKKLTITKLKKYHAQDVQYFMLCRYSP